MQFVFLTSTFFYSFENKLKSTLFLNNIMPILE